MVIFEISTLELVQLQNISKLQKRKCLNLRPKMSHFDVLRLEFENGIGIVIFEINTPDFV